MLQLGQLPVWVVSSANLAREVMQTHDPVLASRPHLPATEILLYECKDVGHSSNGETWREKRKLCVNELLSMKRVRSVQFIREEEVEALVSYIRKACSVINLSEMLVTASRTSCWYKIIGWLKVKKIKKIMSSISSFNKN